MYALSLPSNTHPAHIVALGLTSLPRALAGDEGICGDAGAWIQAFLTRLLQVRLGG